jgi:putative flippase GtrA
MTIALRFGQYTSVALLSAAGDWLVFTAMVSGLGVGHLTSLMTARLAGGLLSFIANRHWTWRHNRVGLTQTGRRFLLLYAFAYALSVATFRGLTKGLGLPPYTSKLATDALCFVVNFLVMNVYVYHRRAGLCRWAPRPLRAALGRGGKEG